MSNAALQMQGFRAADRARRLADYAATDELMDLIHSIFDSIDNLRTQLNEIKSQQCGNNEIYPNRKEVPQLLQQCGTTQPDKPRTAGGQAPGICRTD